MKKIYIKYVILAMIIVIVFINTDYFKYRELNKRLSNVPNGEIIKNVYVSSTPRAASSWIYIRVKKDATPEQIRDCFFEICSLIEKYRDANIKDFNNEALLNLYLHVEIYKKEYRIETNLKDFFRKTYYISYEYNRKTWTERYWDERIPR